MIVIAFLIVGALFFSGTLLFIAILGGLFSPDVSVIGQIIQVYTTWPGPIGTFIKVTWPMLPFAVWLAFSEN